MGWRKCLSQQEKDVIMFRSVVGTLLFLILPSLSTSQEVAQLQRTTHEVVRGETLWGLAERYLGNPYQWPLIYEVNASTIENPDLLEPGQVLIIPAVPGQVAQVREVTVVTEAVEPLAEEMPALLRQVVVAQVVSGGSVPCPGPGQRTVFYEGGEGARSCAEATLPPSQRTAFYTATEPGPDLAGMAAFAFPAGILSTPAVLTRAVPRGLVYAASWLAGPGEDLGSIGTLGRFSDAVGDLLSLRPARAGEQVRVLPAEGARFRVGDLLQSFRSVEVGHPQGSVQHPTGILVVTEATEAGVLARVSAEYDRIWAGDELRVAPGHLAEPGVFPVPVHSDLTAEIVGFAEDRPIQGYGAEAFLDVGEAQGIVIGDVFVAFVNDAGPAFGTESARLQVVLVQGSRATARIVNMRQPGLAVGDLLRLIEKMR